MLKRALSLILVLVVVVCFSIPVFASEEEGSEPDYTGAVSFWDSVLYSWAQRFDSGIPFFNPAQDVIGTLCQSVCTESEDSLHHAASITNDYLTDATGFYTWATCKFCHGRFKLYASDIKDSYQSQVSSLPATQYGSDGAVYVTGVHSDFCFTTPGNFTHRYHCSHLSAEEEDNVDHYLIGNGPVSNNISSFDCDSLIFEQRLCSGGSSLYLYNVGYSYKIVAPISGRYYRVSGSSLDAYCYLLDGTRKDLHYDWSAGSLTSSKYFDAGSLVSTDNVIGRFSDSLIYFYSRSYPPVYKVVPYDYDKDDLVSQYPSSGRPAFTDGKYGVVGSGGNVSLVDNTQSIINETNNTYYNPVTNQISNVTDWTYNYDNRSYNVTTESGNTVTVTYGDKNISITENNVVEGDTVVNNYTIYYVLNDATPTPTPTPSDEPGFSPEPGSPTPTPSGEPGSSPEPGSPTPTPTLGGTDPGDGDSWFDKLLAFVGKLLDGFGSLASLAMDALAGVLSLLTDFSGILSSLFGWLPASWQAILTAGFTCVILVGVIKLFLKG